MEEKNKNIQDLEDKKKEMLDPTSDLFIFKNLDLSDLWSRKLTSFLENMETILFFDCLMNNSSGLLYAFDVGHLYDFSKRKKNERMINYVENLPGFYKDNNVNITAQSQHLFTMMHLSLFIYCKKKELVLDEDAIKTFSFHALTDTFNIIDKEFPQTIDYENWFRTMLS